jgi:hypothetical protein
MSALSRTFVVALAIMLAPEAAIAGGALLGGFICGLPFVPDCADQPATYRARRAANRSAALSAGFPQRAFAVEKFA